MLKAALAGALGFMTIPMAVFLGIIIVAGIKFAATTVAGLGLSPEHYWGGFFLMIGLFVLFAASTPFWA